MGSSLSVVLRLDRRVIPSKVNQSFLTTDVKDDINGKQYDRYDPYGG